MSAFNHVLTAGITYLLLTGAVHASPLEDLGKLLFFDPGLSNPAGQSCASCHAPEAGWTGPDSTVNAGEAIIGGIIPTRYGNRKPPTVAYASRTPLLHKCICPPGDTGDCQCGMQTDCSIIPDAGIPLLAAERTFAGGLFWDGRATGWILCDPLAEQAMAPFLNRLEMNNPNPKHVCLKVKRSDYADFFRQVWGPGSLDCVKDVKGTLERIARSIAAYERSPEVEPFSSKFDLFWQNSVGLMPPVQDINMMNMSMFRGRGLDDQELMGLVIFNTKGKCSACHWLTPVGGSQAPLFTDFGYHNLGIPKNPLNPFYTMPRSVNPDGFDWIDPGLGGFLATTAGMTDANGVSRDYTDDVAANMGRHRTPTLRNVDKRPYQGFVKAYGHNGYFKSLMEIVHFYNCRDVKVPGAGAQQCTDMPPAEPPEVAENLNTTELGNLGLTPMEGMALIRFMQTLTDGFSAN
jgi:cytochrome c peroxidase